MAGGTFIVSSANKDQLWQEPGGTVCRVQSTEVKNGTDKYQTRGLKDFNKDKRQADEMNNFKNEKVRKVNGFKNNHENKNSFVSNSVETEAEVTKEQDHTNNTKSDEHPVDPTGKSPYYPVH